jgi:large subunit ribosomal protein L23
MRNPYDVLIKPIISERTTGLMGENKYTFEVNKDANKIEIKHAVESIFKVTVTNVTTMNAVGKMKRQGRTSGLTASRKKAIVTVKAGQRLPIFEE